MENIIQKYPVVAILRKTPQEDLQAYTSSLYDGGLRCFEVSFSAPDAPQQLAWMKQNMPEDVCLGAGTILNAEQAKQAVEAGATFLLSPSTNEEVLAYCAENKIPFLPGVFSPTDVSVCLRYGFKILKLFPASNFPMSYCKALQGPFPSTKYVAVGGISPENTVAYLKAGYSGVGISSSLVRKELFASKNWAQITEDVKAYLDELKKEGY